MICLFVNFLCGLLYNYDILFNVNSTIWFGIIWKMLFFSHFIKTIIGEIFRNQFSLDQQCYKHSVVFGGCKVLFVDFAIVRKDKKIPIWIAIQVCDVHVAFCSLLNVWEPCIYSIDSLKLYWFIYGTIQWSQQC